MSAYAYTADPASARTGPMGAVRRAVAWLDERGPISWIVLMIGSFIFAGPLGLLVLGFILMTGRFGRGCRRAPEGMRRCGGHFHGFGGGRPTGNSAFDAYKADTLARLEREQEEFEAFLIRLRQARDKAEFDQYMGERAKAAAAGEDLPATGADDTAGKY